MLKIWGRKTSSNVQKLLWGCEELGVSFERIDMGGEFGYSDEYKRLNPNCLIPTLDDDGFILWESNACLRYLAAKHGGSSLWPDDLRDRGNADRWMDWQTTTLWPLLRPAFLIIVRTPPEKRDQAAIDNAAAATGRAWQVLESWLQDRSFVCGTEFTIGDIPLGVSAHRWFTLPLNRVELPNVQAWYERLTQRQGFRHHIMTVPLH